jgi:hypothetical protein
MANATSNANTAVGVNTLGYTTGDYNTAVGSSALSQASTATLNTAIGISAGNSTFVSSNNTFVGAHTDLSSDTWTNSAALGYGAIITASNQVQLGNTSTTNVVSSGNLTVPSVTFSGGGNAMSYFEDYNTTLIFIGVGTVGVNVNIVRVNNKVTFSFYSYAAVNTPTANQIFTSTTSIPSQFYSTNASMSTTGVIPMNIVASNPPYVHCTVVISPSGVVRIYSPFTNGYFPTGGSIQFCNCGFSYHI